MENRYKIKLIIDIWRTELRRAKYEAYILRTKLKRPWLKTRLSGTYHAYRWTKLALNKYSCSKGGW